MDEEVKQMGCMMVSVAIVGILFWVGIIWAIANILIPAIGKAIHG